MLVIKKINTTPISFSFKLDQGEVISDNCPNMTVYGAIFNFKTKNGASIIGKNQNVPFTEITYYGSNGLPQIFDTSLALWTALFTDGFNDCASGSGGTAGGVDEFTELTDTFTFSGNNGCVPVVNTSLQKLVPVFFNNIDELTQLKDVFIPLLEENNVLITKKIGSKVYVATEPKTPQTLPQGLESVLTVGNASIKKIELTSPDTGGVLSLGADNINLSSATNLMSIEAHKITVSDAIKSSSLAPNYLRVNNAVFESNEDASKPSNLITPSTGSSKRVLVASVDGNYADENGNVVSTTDTIISVESTGVALSFIYILASGIEVEATRISIGKYMIHAVVGWGKITIVSFNQTNSDGFIFVDDSVLQPLSSLFITTKTFAGALSDDILNGTAFTFTRLAEVQ